MSVRVQPRHAISHAANFSLLPFLKKGYSMGDYA